MQLLISAICALGLPVTFPVAGAENLFFVSENMLAVESQGSVNILHLDSGSLVQRGKLGQLVSAEDGALITFRGLPPRIIIVSSDHEVVMPIKLPENTIMVRAYNKPLDRIIAICSGKDASGEFQICRLQRFDGTIISTSGESWNSGVGRRSTIWDADAVGVSFIFSSIGFGTEGANAGVTSIALGPNVAAWAPVSASTHIPDSFGDVLPYTQTRFLSGNTLLRFLVKRGPGFSTAQSKYAKHDFYGWWQKLIGPDAINHVTMEAWECNLDFVPLRKIYERKSSLPPRAVAVDKVGKRIALGFEREIVVICFDK